MCICIKNCIGCFFFFFFGKVDSAIIFFFTFIQKLIRHGEKVKFLGLIQVTNTPTRNGNRSLFAI